MTVEVVLVSWVALTREAPMIYHRPRDHGQRADWYACRSDRPMTARVLRSRADLFATPCAKCYPKETT